MPRSRSRLAMVAIGLTMALALPSAAGAGTRIPVSSVDDPTSPTANRIAAVTEIIKPTNARLVRVINAYPPNPCAEDLPVCLAALSALEAYGSLRASVVEACAGRTAEGAGDATIADADAYAADTSTTGIANQLASIATVLGNAGSRFDAIFYPSPGPPDTLEIRGALNALAEAIDFGVRAATTWEVPEGEFPPNPVCPA